MKVNRINSQVLEGAVALLRSAVPEITPEKLVAALKSYNSTLANAPEKPYTRQEVCNLLSISIPTLHRMIKAGAVRKIVVSKHSVRIDPASVRELLNMEQTKEVKK